jgi:hypothetical protein
VPNIIFRVERLQAVILRQVKPPLYGQHSIFHTDINIALFDSRHFKDNRQVVFRFVDVRRRHKHPGRNRGLVFVLKLSLFLNLQFLHGSHDTALICWWNRKAII